MEVKINREIRDYQESIFFGMNLRQLIFALLAVGVAVGICFGLREPLGTETVSWLCILGAFPFAALGFIKYNGMNAEQFVAAFVKSEFLTPRTLTFQSENLYDALLAARADPKPDRKQKKNKKEDAQDA
jgi:hypothetical protein